MNHHQDSAADIEFGSDHGTVKSYIVGFIISLVLTIIPFVIVAKHLLSNSGMYVVIGIFAVAQLFVQLVFFLHLSFKSQARWNLNVFLFTFLVVVILVLGSLWIMANLDYFMMH
ncbi:MAG: cytochrome o ubiquinol oxidase subunit IV [Gammaproteobacteria bacterium]|nr:cytochrome o ubiquinol oxidase subunit IV [Gammaproteobacteria bacterium]